MDSRMHFTFSDTIAGSVVAYQADEDTFTLRTIDGREFEVALTNQTFAEVTRNLGEAYIDATGQMREMLDRGRILFVYGIFYPEGGDTVFEAKRIVFVGRTRAGLCLRAPGVVGAAGRARSRTSTATRSGPTANIDFSVYRTQITLEGDKLPGTRQETDTISRLVYGFATAYLMTGEDRFLEVAEKGTEYLRDHMRTVDAAEGIAYWVHGIDTAGGKEKKILASEFGDDYDAIPAYEQIYALAGPTQTFRVTGDPRIQSDIELTHELFNRFFLDREGEGFFSHIDPITFDPAQRDARRQPVAEELELGRRPRAGVPDQRLARDGRRAVRRLPPAHGRHDRQPLPRLREEPVRERALPRGLVAGPLVQVAAQPRRRRPQPEDRVEPDAHQQRPAEQRSTSSWRGRSPRSCRRSAATGSAAAGTT